MLYLEDYIELIEQLPQDLRDRFTDMRELDLKVQNTVDTLDLRVRRFFSDAIKSKNEQVQEEYKSIHHCYKLALDDAEEKVSMASQIYDLVDRHLRKLDQELSRFKMELEADCSGITEILERRSVVNGEERSLDLLYNSTFNSSGPENTKKKFGDIDRFSTVNLSNGIPEKMYNCSYNPLGASYPLGKSNTSHSIQSSNQTQKPTGVGQQLSTNLSAKSLELKDQARQGNATPKSMTAAQRKAEQLGNSLSLSGLLTASVAKPSTNFNSPSPSAPSNSYVDVTGNYLPSSATPTSSNIQQKHAGLQNRQQKAGRRTHKTIGSLQNLHTQPDKPFHEGASIDWVPDPNEPTYCLCNQVSYGEMVGCDNPSCPIEWFHYGCVGLTDAPKGKWYCPDCAIQVKKRRLR